MHARFKQDWWWSIKVLERSCITALRVFGNPKNGQRMWVSDGLEPATGCFFLIPRYWFKCWMLNQPWQEWDPWCMTYHIQIFINFRTSGSLPDCKSAALELWPQLLSSFNVPGSVVGSQQSLDYGISSRPLYQTFNEETVVTLTHRLDRVPVHFWQRSGLFCISQLCQDGRRIWLYLL